MSDLARALDSFRAGKLSQGALLAEIERQLDAGDSSVPAFLSRLEAEQARAPLPDNIHRAIVRTVARWSNRTSTNASVDAPAQVPENASAGSAASAPEQSDEGADVSDVTEYDDLTLPSANAGTGERDTRSIPESRGAPIHVGSILLNRFELVESIGRGGTSTVFKAIDLRRVEAHAAEPYVAVKILTVPIRGVMRSLALLQGEAHKLQSLPHPNIVRVIDCDRDGTTVFMTLEYLVGDSLTDRFTEPGFEGVLASEGLRILECIAAAMAFAHRNNIVHGDLKPGNVIVTKTGDVKVIDFGIARLVSGAQHSAGEIPFSERPGARAYTPRYASPQVLERQAPDARDDVYGLACIAYELLTGHRPFAAMTSLQARDAGMKPQRSDSISRVQFKAIVHGLEFDREKRTANAQLFMQEFNEAGLRKVARTTAVAAAAITGALAVAYFIAYGPIAQWIAGQGGPNLASPLPGAVFRDCAACPLMKSLHSGRFEQGAAAEDPQATPLEEPKHPVVIGYSFGIGVNEITVREFTEFATAASRKASGCETYEGTWKPASGLGWQNAGYPQTATHPATCVSWRDAQDYAHWLSGKTGFKYRLASASEWEYAARAGTTAQHPWEGHPESACAYANVADQAAAARFPGWAVQPCSDGYVYTSPVGRFAPNAFGLYDMLGNVSEWVADCWHPDYRRAPSDGSVWQGGDCAQHEMRGGSWFTPPANVSVAARSHFATDYRSNSAGFRLVREFSP